MYHGQGYTQGDVDSMTLPVLYNRAQRLLKQKEKEKEAHEEALRKAKARARRKH